MFEPRHLLGGDGRLGSPGDFDLAVDPCGVMRDLARGCRRWLCCVAGGNQLENLVLARGERFRAGRSNVA